MDIAKQIERVLGVHPLPLAATLGYRAKEQQRPDSSDDLIGNWECQGYPGVFSVSIHLTYERTTQWYSDRTLLFPRTCCACSEPATSWSDFVPRSNVAFLRLRAGDVQVRAIPHCDVHKRREPWAFVRVDEISDALVIVHLFCLRRAFLQETLDLQAIDGEFAPPWRAFPEAHPLLWRSRGTSGQWVRAWMAWWMRLGSPQRKEYLARWDASPDWASTLLQIRLPSVYR
jgi:hypothetical protein